MDASWSLKQVTPEIIKESMVIEEAGSKIFTESIKTHKLASVIVTVW